MIQVGDKVKKKFSLADHADGRSDSTTKVYYGNVIWIHPQRRFYLAEFEISKGNKIRSCFKEKED